MQAFLKYMQLTQFRNPVIFIVATFLGAHSPHAHSSSRTDRGNLSMTTASPAPGLKMVCSGVASNIRSRGLARPESANVYICNSCF
ncbi:hypothetical protein BDR03DRAFT_945659 [Suillus americanus]|nr:hypothetical protein BDR03DRAFT_945659 [Suillus americanus]